MAIDAITYGAARKYVEQTADALGAVRGAPCRIESITKVDGANVVKFKWIGDSGAVNYSTMVVEDGTEGISIESATIN